MKIYGNHDLKTSYETLQFYKLMSAGQTGAKSKALQDRILEIKAAIRTYNRKQETLQARIVRDDGIDGGIVLAPIPAACTTADEADRWFQRNEYMDRPNSAYDCTGRLFTNWYRIVKRGGRYWAYHCVSCDC